MKGGTGYTPESNPNALTVSILQQMADYYSSVRDEWRPFAYRRAIGQLKKQTRKIATYDEAFNIKFVGHRIAEKIVEISLTNRLQRLDYALMDPNDKVFQVFIQIYGVGVYKAQQ